jgi:hypothetical protein
VNNKVDDNAGRNEANAAMLNQSVEQNTRETRNLNHVFNRMKLEIANLTNIIVELQKKVEENAIKMENKKHHDDEQRNQNKKGKGKKKDKRSDSDDENNDPHKPKKISEENCQDKEFIELLRNDEDLIILNDHHMIKEVDWAIMTNMLWEFIRGCNVYESECRKKAYEYIQNLNKIHSFWTCRRKLRHDPRISDLRITIKPLINVLDENRMLPHPFIIQCIWPGCTDYFGDHDKFKEQLKEEHNVGQDEINNVEIYALMLT